MKVSLTGECPLLTILMALTTVACLLLTGVTISWGANSSLLALTIFFTSSESVLVSYPFIFLPDMKSLLSLQHEQFFLESELEYALRSDKVNLVLATPFLVLGDMFNMSPKGPQGWYGGPRAVTLLVIFFKMSSPRSLIANKLLLISERWISQTLSTLTFPSYFSF